MFSSAYPISCGILCMLTMTLSRCVFQPAGAEGSDPGGSEGAVEPWSDSQCQPLTCALGLIRFQIELNPCWDKELRCTKPGQP